MRTSVQEYLKQLLNALVKTKVLASLDKEQILPLVVPQYREPLRFSDGTHSQQFLPKGHDLHVVAGVWLAIAVVLSGNLDRLSATRRVKGVASQPGRHFRERGTQVAIAETAGKGTIANNRHARQKHLKYHA